MIDYNKGKIYKIEPINSVDDADVYFGSTTKTTLAERMATHRRNYKCFQQEKYGLISSFTLFDKYGVQNCYIYLIETFPCNTRDELRTREAFYIKNNQCINKVVPFRTREETLQRKREYHEENKSYFNELKKQYNRERKEEIVEYHRHYYEANKEKIHERNTRYYENNKETMRALNKINYEKHKDEMKVYQSNWYQNNKTRLTQKTECECGLTCNLDNIKRHKNSKIHNERMQNIEIQS